ncbi:MAG: DUF2798 domain-containing protein [Betaproteobacteria bacterium]|jgi:hypothetical protein|nr:DUF2798 domain-containing protein [Betaproteobacteria bacterium]
MINLSDLIFSIVMGFLMSVSITLVTTFIDIGFDSNFFWKWLEAWLLVYPVAIVCILVHKPLASKITNVLAERFK